MKLQFVCIVLAINTVAFTQTKTEKIEQLLDVMNTEKTIEMMKQQYVTILSQASPDAPTSLLDSLFDRMDKQGLYAITIPIYDKHLDEESIDAMLSFYKTDAGQRVIEKMPLIMQESMQAGARWGQQIMQQIMEKLKEKGYEIQKL
jgi:hypothetical protein